MMNYFFEIVHSNFTQTVFGVEESLDFLREMISQSEHRIKKILVDIALVHLLCIVLSWALQFTIVLDLISCAYSANRDVALADVSRSKTWPLLKDQDFVDTYSGAYEICSPFPYSGTPHYCVGNSTSGTSLAFKDSATDQDHRPFFDEHSTG